jgi:hypothetical protein
LMVWPDCPDHLDWLVLGETPVSRDSARLGL